MIRLVEGVFDLHKESLIMPQPVNGAKVEISMDKTLAFQSTQQKRLLRQEGIALPMVVLQIAAIGISLAEYPEFNCYVSNGERVFNDNVNVGLVASMGAENQHGSLLVVKDADKRCLWEIAKSVQKQHKNIKRMYNSGIQLTEKYARMLQKIKQAMPRPSIIINTLSLYGVEICHPYLPQGVAASLSFGPVKQQLRMIEDNIVPEKIMTVYGVGNPLQGSGVTAMRFLGRLRDIMESADYPRLFN